MNPFTFGAQGVVCDPQQMERALRLFFEPGQVTELRALDATLPCNSHRPGVVSGYFNDPGALIGGALALTSAKGIYVVLNPLNPALLARASNRIRPAFRDPLTGDHDILGRRWFPIDCDPVRPAGISATSMEHAASLASADQIATRLSGDGWPDPLFIDSGNGAHLLYRIDLPREDQGIVQRCLKALGARFDTPAVTVDHSVHNPARIWKLPGTVAAKGDDTPERPHRMATILCEPSIIDLVPRHRLEALAAEAPSAALRPAAGHSRGTAGGFDLQDWITQHNLQVTGPEPWQGGFRWIFAVCPWDESHSNRSAYILQLPNGAIAAGCHHNGCNDKDWRALRELIEPQLRNRRQEAYEVAPSGSHPAIALEYRRAMCRRKGR